ncbi:MAG: hypothetical protein DU481_13275 [Nitrosomonas sp.]
MTVAISTPHTYQRSNTVEFSIKEQIIIHLLREVVDAFRVLPAATGKRTWNGHESIVRDWQRMKNIFKETKRCSYK